MSSSIRMDMAKKAKRQFHCQKCNSPCEIYKKGRKHRVFVCPSCGILATNPFSLKGALRGGVGSIPIAGGILEESGLTDMVFGSTPKAKETGQTPIFRQSTYPLSKKVQDALR